MQPCFFKRCGLAFFSIEPFYRQETKRRHLAMPNKLILLTCISLVFFISGCSAPIIYLNDYDLKKSNFEKVKTSLEESGFNVKPISIKPPSNIKDSTIITGPKPTVKHSFHRLVSLLEDLGYSNIRITSVESGNHWYRGNNIGLYLFDDGIRSSPESEVIGKYATDNCESMVSLILSAEGNFNITYADGNELLGEWLITSMPYLNLRNKRTGLNFYYQINVQEQSDLLGKVDVVTLFPLDDQYQIRDCIFYMGIRRAP